MHFEGIGNVLVTHWLITLQNLFEPKNQIFLFFSVLRKLFVCFWEQRKFWIFQTSVLCRKPWNLECQWHIWNYKGKYFLSFFISFLKFWWIITELCEWGNSKRWSVSNKLSKRILHVFGRYVLYKVLRCNWESIKLSGVCKMRWRKGQNGGDWIRANVHVLFLLHSVTNFLWRFTGQVRKC